MRTNLRLGWIGGAVLALLAGCGGDDAAPAPGGAGGGTLTLSAANPAPNNTTIDLTTATTVGNEVRPADGFSATPYCEVFAEGAQGANGVTYAVQVYFRQSDKAAMHVAVIGSGGGALAGYAVFDSDNGNPITNVVVDTVARSVTFQNKVLGSGNTDAGTLNGTASFPANSTAVAACGV